MLDLASLALDERPALRELRRKRGLMQTAVPLGRL
jgi:hypothetical protein